MDRRYLGSPIELSKLFAKPCQVHVKRVVVHDRAVRPCCAGKLAPAESSTRTARKRGDQTKLGGCQRDLPLSRADLMAGWIQQQARHLERLAATGTLQH